MTAKQWNERTSDLLTYLYETMNVCNWEAIALEITSLSSEKVTAQDCRNRYVELKGEVAKDQWTPEEEEELYRLHNQHGNRWTIISFNLIGRSENCVKNHFYSKLRKSLRTLNKIAKNHLKKAVREVSDGVIYKLTEATDEALKQDPEISQEHAIMCYDLKNKLLRYDRDQKEVMAEVDFEYERQFIEGLLEFNRSYKKKSKKERISILGSENLKKGRETKKLKALHKKESERKEETSFQEDPEEREEHINSESKTSRKQGEGHHQPKKMINLVLKEPSQQQIEEFEKESIRQKVGGEQIQDILRAEGILENVEYGSGALFRRDVSSKSFSVRSESSNPDMFGDSRQINAQDFVFPTIFNQMSQAGDSNQIFNVEINEKMA